VSVLEHARRKSSHVAQMLHMLPRSRMQRALRTESKAHDEYIGVLRVFADLILTGKQPPDN